MTLQASGAISLGNVDVELGQTATTPISMGSGSPRTLAGVPSGAISMSNFYSKSNGTALTVSASPANPSATRATNTTGSVSVNSTATATGGSGTGFTYSWAYVSGTSFTITNGGTATATFSTTVAPNDNFVGVYRCTATDSIGGAGHTNTVDSNVQLNGFVF